MLSKQKHIVINMRKEDYMNKDMNSNSKIRQHKILNKPILGAIVLAIYGLLFYQVFASIGGESKILSFLLGTLGGILLLIIH